MCFKTCHDVGLTYADSSHDEQYELLIVSGIMFEYCVIVMCVKTMSIPIS
jgi:hypothetical protein